MTILSSGPLVMKSNLTKVVIHFHPTLTTIMRLKECLIQSVQSPSQWKKYKLKTINTNYENTNTKNNIKINYWYAYSKR